MSAHPSEGLYGLIGFPVKHSLSSAMHNAAFKAKGIAATYRLFEIEPSRLESFLLDPDTEITDTTGAAFTAGSLAGFNITIPHKVRAKEILEAHAINKSKSAARYSNLVGAINTVRRDPDGLIWSNSDAKGFIEGLKNDLDFQRTHVGDALVFGCGGAGRAVVSGLCNEDEGMVRTVYMFEPNPAIVSSVKDYYQHFPAASRIRQKFTFIRKQDIVDVLPACNLLVNASPVGMCEDDPSVIDKNLLHKDLFIYDLVYNRVTQLIQDARKRGIPAAGGLSMLLYQGVLAWELWMGEVAPVEVMRKALEENL